MINWKRFLYRIEAFDEQFMSIKKMEDPVFEELFPEGISKSPSHENPAASGSGQVIEISNFSAFQASKTQLNARFHQNLGSIFKNFML